MVSPLSRNIHAFDMRISTAELKEQKDAIGMIFGSTPQAFSRDFQLDWESI